MAASGSQAPQRIWAERLRSGGRWLAAWIGRRSWLKVGGYSLLGVLAAELYSNEIGELVAWVRGKEDADPSVLWLLGSVGLALLLAWVAVRYSRFNSASITPTAGAEVRRILITGISLPGDGDANSSNDVRSLKALELAAQGKHEGVGYTALTQVGRISRFDALTWSHAELKKEHGSEPHEFFGANPYLQTLRAIRPHWDGGGKLLVILLPSTESAPLKERMATLIQTVFNNDDGSRLRVAFYEDPGAVDYEDYNAVQKALTRILEQLAVRDHQPPVIAPVLRDKAPLAIFPGIGMGALAGADISRQVCIDVTAGQKIFSIAAAVATLNSKAIFSYVPGAGADADKPGVRFFDARCEIIDLRSGG